MPKSKGKTIRLSGSKGRWRSTKPKTDWRFTKPKTEAEVREYIEDLYTAVSPDQSNNGLALLSAGHERKLKTGTRPWGKLVCKQKKVMRPTKYDLSMEIERLTEIAFMTFSVTLALLKLEQRRHKGRSPR